MASPVADSKTPVLVAVAIALLALVLGILVSSGAAKILFGLIAAGGSIPAGVAMWKGIQQEQQTSLAMGVGALFLSLGVALVLLIWGVIVIVA
jgi:hypothetical protein